MIDVVTGTRRVRATDALAVRVARTGAADPREATIGIAIADPALASAMTTAIAGALEALAIELTAVAAPIVRVRSRTRLARVVDRLAGAIAIVRVTPRNAKHLVTLLDGIRGAGALGVQLVWDGSHDEDHVFAALERARSTPAAAPVVLAAIDDHARPVAALRVLVAHRARRSS